MSLFDEKKEKIRHSVVDKDYETALKLLENITMEILTMQYIMQTLCLIYLKQI